MIDRKSKQLVASKYKSLMCQAIIEVKLKRIVEKR